MDDQKGMDDFINKNGIEAFREVLENAYELDDYIELGYHEKTKKRKSSNSKKRTHAETVKELSNFYGDRIKYNEMTNEIEKDNAFYQIETAYIDISREVDIEVNKNPAIDYLATVAKDNSYHPVINYLESVKHLANDKSIDECIADIQCRFTEILGITNPLELTYLTKTLVAAVKRVNEPGCFFKRVCIFLWFTRYRKVIILERISW